MYFLQVAQNVDKHQFNTFVKSKGLDPDALSDTEKVELRKDMMSELYPGKTLVLFNEADLMDLISQAWIKFLNSSGRPCYQT